MFDSLPPYRPVVPSRAQATKMFFKRVWTNEEVNLLRDLYTSGVPSRDIGLRLGMSRSQLFKKLKQLGLTGQRVTEALDKANQLREEILRLHAQGLTQAEIGEIVGRHQTTVSKILRSSINQTSKVT